MANCGECHIMLYHREQFQGHQKPAALPLGRGLFLCSSASGNVNICVFKTTYHWEGSRGGDACWDWVDTRILDCLGWELLVSCSPFWHVCKFCKVRLPIILILAKDIFLQIIYLLFRLGHRPLSAHHARPAWLGRVWQGGLGEHTDQNLLLHTPQLNIFGIHGCYLSW